MMSWGFWILFAVLLCAIAEGGMRIEKWLRARKAASQRKYRRAA